MIINGFGGDGRVQGSSELITTLTYNITSTYQGSCYKKITSGTSEDRLLGAISGTTPVTSSPSIPTPLTYYNLGYKAIQYVPSFNTTSLTSGSYLFTATESSSASISGNYTIAIGVFVAMSPSYYMALIGTGIVNLDSVKWTGSGRRQFGKAFNFSAMTWTTYMDIDSLAYTSISELPNHLNARKGRNLAATYCTVDMDNNAAWLYGVGNNNLSSSIAAPTLSLEWGMARDNTTGTYSSIGTIRLEPSATVYSGTSTTAQTIRATPPVIPIKIDVYGIN